MQERVRKPSPIKTIYKKFIWGYTEIEKKEEDAGARSFLCDV